MSDIGLDGVESFILLILLAGSLLLALLVLSLLAWLRARRTQQAFTKTPFFPHLVGLSCSLLGALIAFLILEKGYVFFKDPSGFSPDYLAVPRWMDHHAWLWITILLSLWPLGFFSLKFLRFNSGVGPKNGNSPVL